MPITPRSLSPSPSPAELPATPPGQGRPVVSMLNAGAIVVAALYFGQELLVPLALAAMLAFVLAPASSALQRLGLPRSVAVLIAVVLAFVVIGGIGVVFGRQFEQLAGDLPAYQATVLAKWRGLTQGGGWLAEIAKAVPLLGSPQKSAGGGSVLGIDPSTGLKLAGRLAQPLLGPIATAFVVLVFTIFMLLASEDLCDRLVRLIGRRDMHRTTLALNEAAGRLSRFFVFQLGLNSAFGALIGSCLWLTGLPNPVLWGILAGLMRFIPYVGTPLALIPPLLLALAVVPGWSLALVVLVLYLSCEMVTGQVVEPYLYGHSTGLSPIAVIVATAFWALLWGPVGLLLATPLTVCLVVIGRNVEALSFLDVMLGDRSPLDAAETFYQRALEGRLMTLAKRARKQIAGSSLTDYYDLVVLPGLALAQGDLARDERAFERLEAIHSQVEAFLTAMQRGVLPAIPAARREGAVACIPARGQLDDLAAALAAQVLGAAGFQTQVVPNQSLGAGSSAEAGASTRAGTTMLCCLSVLEQGSSVSGIRYLIRRIQKRLPDAEILVCLWHAQRDSELLSALRSDEQGNHVVLSLGELLAYGQTLASRRRRLGEARIAAPVAG